MHTSPLSFIFELFFFYPYINEIWLIIKLTLMGGPCGICSYLVAFYFAPLGNVARCKQSLLRISNNYFREYP